MEKQFCCHKTHARMIDRFQEMINVYTDVRMNMATILPNDLKGAAALEMQRLLIIPKKRL